MGNRNRARSGKGILIAVVLGPLCAAAADVPGRAIATPAEPVANLPVQVFEHARIAPGGVAAVSKATSVRKQQNHHRPSVVNVTSVTFLDSADGPISRLTSSADDSIRRYWLENATSTGP